MCNKKCLLFSTASTHKKTLPYQQSQLDGSQYSCITPGSRLALPPAAAGAPGGGLWKRGGGWAQAAAAPKYSAPLPLQPVVVCSLSPPPPWAARWCRARRQVRWAGGASWDEAPGRVPSCMAGSGAAAAAALPGRVGQHLRQAGKEGGQRHGPGCSMQHLSVLWLPSRPATHPLHGNCASPPSTQHILVSLT